MIYLDSSAIVELIRPEAESAALAGWLNARAERAVTSVPAEVEAPRALRRAAPVRLATMPGVLNRITCVEMDAAVRATAAAYLTAGIRPLDAAHLATAEVLVAADEVVTYDVRQAAAVRAAGLVVAAPRRRLRPERNGPVRCRRPATVAVWIFPRRCTG